jgi:hypothetical protein
MSVLRFDTSDAHRNTHLVHCGVVLHACPLEKTRIFADAAVVMIDILDVYTV